jgi:hypothetical protein
MYDHRKEAILHLRKNKKKQTIKINIIQSIWEHGLDFSEEIMFDNLTEQEAKELEIVMIAKYGRINLGTGCLANLTNGGEGTSGYIYSEEQRREISKRMSGENNPGYGKPRSE